MTAHRMFAPLVAALFAVCVGLAALPGCNGPAKKDEKKDEKKEEPKPAPTPDPKGGGTTGTTPPDVPPKPTLGVIDKEADDTATAFLRDVMHGNARAESLSAAFVRAIGKPAVLPSDKTSGYSPDSARSWLRKVGEGINFGLAMYRAQVGDTVYIRGSISGPRLGAEAGKTGSYSLRLVKDGGAWKVDWLSASSVTPPDNIQGQVVTAPTPEGIAQGFAAAAFVETLADKDGVPQAERATLLGAAMTPTLRAAMAAPFDQDKQAGLDFNPGKLGTEAVKVGGGTTAFTATRVGDLPEYKVELTKPTGKKAYTLKLIKGAPAHEWLVNEVTEVKG